MAYNALSGNVIAAQNYIPGELIIGNIVSGNLSTSDGSSVINVPRVSNATDNAIITNVGGDANTLTCESNLTFDGSAFNITGELTASIGISASFFEGDGGRLTGIDASSITASGPVYSVQFHDSLDSSFTGSSTLLFESDILKLGGGLKLNRTAYAAALTASATNYYIGIDSSGGTIDVRLPNAANLSDGQTYVIKDEAGSANTNNITILASGSQTIDGQNSIVLESPYASIQLYCNGANKFFIF